MKAAEQARWQFMMPGKSSRAAGRQLIAPPIAPCRRQPTAVRFFFSGSSNGSV
jgi:hypothetical protein